MQKISLIGELLCAHPEDAKLVARLLPDHIRLSRAEPGCLSFEVTQTEDSLLWSVAETFADRASFDAHQTRTRASVWGIETRHIPRRYEVTESE